MALPGRTTSALVTAIITTDGSNLSPYINAANELVTELCSASGYTLDRMTQIETWLAAHFYATYDPRKIRESVSTLMEENQGRTLTGLKASIYGQQAIRLDTAGNLALMDNAMDKEKIPLPALAARFKVGVRWLGGRYRGPYARPYFPIEEEF